MMFHCCFGKSSSSSPKACNNDLLTTAIPKSKDIALLNNAELYNDEIVDEDTVNVTTDSRILSHSSMQNKDQTIDTTFDTDRNKNKISSRVVHKANILLEIVGATGLQQIRQQSQMMNNIDTFCIIKLNDKEIHRTKTIVNDYQPIFTCKTKSLCLVENLQQNDNVVVELCCPQNVIVVPGTKSIVGSALYNVIGTVKLNFEQLLNGQSIRQEYAIDPNQEITSAKLALRYRQATTDDISYFKVSSTDDENINSKGPNNPRLSFISSASSSFSKNSTIINKDHASDVEFRNVSKKSILQSHRKKITLGNNKTEIAYRVFPAPDPKNPKATEYMTLQQMDQFMKQPSREWVEAGWGDFGSVYLEVLGCDNLPNMDTQIIDGLTDSFIACVFEDTFVRTSVIFDNLNPRWPPWSHRAIKFNIGHPSSIVYLGVFDYDENFMDAHDPIGRVLIHLDTFEPNTVYTLKYPLYNGDTPDDEEQGTITLRLEIRWKKSLKEVSRAQSYLRPPRFIINTKTDRSWKTIRYLTRGDIDMTDVTIDSVKIYASELIDHIKEYCYLLDIIAGVFLWRGTIQLMVFGREMSIWFPLDSMFLFAALGLAVEYPIYIPSIILYSFAYALLRNNYGLSTNPSPWLRTKSFVNIAMTNLGAGPRRIRILPGTGDEEAKALARIEEYRMHRVTGFLYESLNIILKVYRVYSKTTPVDISTVSKSGNLVSKLYVNYLAYLHMLLKYLCKYIRVVKNFVNWHSNSTYSFTVHCLVLATFWCLCPYKMQCVWLVRIPTWLIFGPWIKLIDLFWVRKYYRTREEIIRDGVPETTEEMKADIANRPNIVEPLLQSNFVESMANAGRTVVEDNMKLRDYREKIFGKYSERIPLFDTSRFPNVPLPTSFAQPLAMSTVNEASENGNNSFRSLDSSFGEDDEYEDLPHNAQNWTYVSGQKVSGTMIPHLQVKI